MNETLITKMILTAWSGQNKQIDKLLSEIDENSWMQPTAPNRNSGYYILGHLVAVNDALLPLLGLGEKHHPVLYELFVKNPEKDLPPTKPSLSELKTAWSAINADLERKFSALTPNQWLERHTSVSEEDYKREPHRNRLNVVISRTVHQGYHIGQIVYLKNKSVD